MAVDKSGNTDLVKQIIGESYADVLRGMDRINDFIKHQKEVSENPTDIDIPLTGDQKRWLVAFGQAMGWEWQKDTASFEISVDEETFWKQRRGK